MIYRFLVFIFSATALFGEISLENFLGPNYKIEALADQGGSFINSVYLVTTEEGEELILKAENPVWKEKKTLNEVNSIAFLEKNTNIPVPHVVYFDSSSSVEYILMDRIQGQALNLVFDEIYKNRESYRALLEQLADVIAELKSIRFEQIGNFANAEQVGGIVDFPFYELKKPCGSFSEYAHHWLNYYTGEMKRLSRTDHPNREFFLKYIPVFEEWLKNKDFSFLDDPKDTFVYSHQDFVMKNILVDGHTITGILDWEWSGAALPEFEALTGFDFLVTEEDRETFKVMLEDRGVQDFFDPPPAKRALFYRFIGDIYTIISCYEWIDGKLEHTAKFLSQKLEQRKIRSTPDFDMQSYIREKASDLDQCILIISKEM